MVVTIGVNEPFCRDTACVCAGKDVPRGYEWVADVVRGAGVDLRFRYVRLEDELAPALRAGEIDGVIAKSWPAITAFRTARVGCDRLCDVPLPNGSPDLTGVFITTVDGPVRSMADLTGRRLGTGGPDSYENFHAVNRLLQALDVKPGTRRTYDRCVHAAVSVIEGDTDTAVVSNYCVRFGLDDYVGQPGVFRTVGETAPIPFATFAVSTALPEDLRERLRASLLDPAGDGVPRDRFPGGLRPPAAWTPEELESL